MKKLAFVLLIILLVSCSNDDDKDYPLDGTIWVNNEDVYKEFGFGKTDFYIYAKGNDVNETNGEDIEETIRGTYEYTPPFVKIKATNKITQQTSTSSFVIKENKFEWGGYIYELQ